MLLRRRGGSGRGRGGLELEARTAAAALLVGAALLAALAAATGVLLERRREDERLAELRSRVERLRVRQGRVASLAARMDSVERAYARLRRSLAPAEGPDERGPRLPAPPEGDVAPEGTAATGGGLPPGWPLARAGFVTRRFRAASGEHHGLDVAVPAGSYLRAPSAGVVREVGRDSVYGLFVRLGHRGGYVSLYAHASNVFVRPGDSVTRGRVIGLSGNSGRSTAPHLHVEVRRGGEPVDPLRFFRGAG